jgi:hypothetical protein
MHLVGLRKITRMLGLISGNNSMSFLPSTQHLFDSHYMFRPQRVIFRCYKHVVLKLHQVTHFFFACLELLEYVFTLSALGWLDTKMFLYISVKLYFMCFSFYHIGRARLTLLKLFKTLKLVKRIVTLFTFKSNKCYVDGKKNSYCY